MNSKTIMGITLFVLGAAGAWLLLGDGGATESNAVSTSSSGNGGSTPEFREVAPVSADEYRAIETTGFAGEPDEESAQPALPEDDLTFVLVRDPSGAPVVGAQVALIPSGGGRRGRGFRGFGADATESREVYRTVKSGPDGFALLSPLPARRFTVEATHGRRLGTLDFDQREDPALGLPEGAAALIVLWPIKEVLVEVLAPGGTPTPGVQVRARAEPAEENSERRGAGREGRRGGRGGGRNGPGGVNGRGPGFGGDAGPALWTRTPDGRALLEISKRHDELYDAERIEVEAILPGRERVFASTALASEGRSNVTLRIPDSMTLIVNLKDRQGAPFRESTRLSWMVAAPAGAQASDPRQFFTRSPMGSRVVTDGKVLLGGLEPGFDISLVTHPSGRLEETTKVTLPATGASIEVDALIGDAVPHVRLSIAEPSGERVSGLTLLVRVVHDNDPAAGGSNESWQERMLSRMGSAARLGGRERTGPDGKIRFQVRSDAGGTIQIYPENGGPEDGGRRFGNEPQRPATPLATLRFEGVPAGADRDLGEVRLSRPALLAAGRVVDREGVGLPGVRVEVSVSRGDDAAGPGRQGRGRGGRQGGGRSATTDSQGHFKLLGFTEASDVCKIEASSREVQSESIPFIAGSADLVVLALRSGGLDGKVRAFDETLDLRISLALVSSGGDRTDVRRRDDGSFRARGLAAGAYTLEVLVNGRMNQEVRGVMVPEAETARPVALQDLVVGGDFMRAFVHVQDGQGRPISGARVSFDVQELESAGRESTGQGRGRGDDQRRTDDSGRCHVVIRQTDVVEVRVSGDGFAPKEFPRAVFPLSVTVNQGAQVRVTFDPALPAVPALTGYRLFLSPKTEDTGASPATDPRAFFRNMFRVGGRGGMKNLNIGASEVVFENVAPGTHELRAMVTTSDGNGGRGGGFRLPFVLGTIQVTAQDTQSVSVRIDPVAVAQSLAEQPQNFGRRGGGPGGGRGERGGAGSEAGRGGRRPGGGNGNPQQGRRPRGR